MKGDRVEIVIDAGSGTTRTYDVVATRAGRKVAEALQEIRDAHPYCAGATEEEAE